MANRLLGFSFCFTDHNHSLEEEHQLPDVFAPFGIYLSERLNKILTRNWRSFATQNHCDPSGVFLSVLWSGPLLIIAMQSSSWKTRSLIRVTQ